MVMIDPKKVELAPYNGIPHLLTPVVTEPKKAAIILQKMVAEMENRYELFAETNTRNIKAFNEKVENSKNSYSKLPYIVIVVDELADLMMVASNEVETSIARLAQMARAAGMHLIIATQRPSTDVITGLIKANIPSRIAFSVSSGIDSRTILDSSGAEKLLGRGDMLLSEQSSPNLTRIQGAFLSDDEVYRVVEFITDQIPHDTVESNYDQELLNVQINDLDEELDELYDEVLNDVVQMQKASASFIQRKYRVGYNRALRIMDQLEANGVISANEGPKPRRVLIGDENEGY
jgi:S-DNA-T family DNA segregation ATPase FtsK/SpoIIIE